MATHDKKQQWAIIFILTLLTILSLVLPILAYCLTGNWLTVTPSISAIPLGFAWRLLIKRIFPPSEKDYELETIKITHASEKQHKQKSQTRLPPT